MSDSLQYNKSIIPPKQNRFGVFLLLFCLAWLGYGQVPSGWTQIVKDGTTVIARNDITSENIAVRGGDNFRNINYTFNPSRGFGGTQRVEYIKGPFTQDGWYYFTIGADDGFSLYKVTTHGDVEISKRESWAQHQGICRTNFIYLKAGESIKIIHTNASDNKNHKGYRFHLSNFASISVQNISLGVCSNDELPLNYRLLNLQINHDYHVKKGNNNECIFEQGHEASYYWEIQKKTKNRICGSDKKRLRISNSSSRNVFDLIKQVCPDDPYGSYDIRLEYEITNRVDTASIFSNTITVTIPEIGTPPKVSECAKVLKTALWDTTTNNVKTTADKVEIEKSKLDISIEDALACCPMSWYITEKGSTTKLFQGTGQPSTFSDKIELSDNDTQDKKYSITYILNCTGYSKTEDITIRPRPKIEIQ